MDLSGLTLAELEALRAKIHRDRDALHERALRKTGKTRAADMEEVRRLSGDYIAVSLEIAGRNSG